MLFRQEFLNGIRTGSITLAFRRWQRPSVRPNGTLLTPAGQLEIGSVSQVSEAEISPEEGRLAGYPSREILLAELNRRSTGAIYRIELRAVRPDPRVELCQTLPDERNTDRILHRLHRLDTQTVGGAWTSRVLEVIAQYPGGRAGDLSGRMAMAKEVFKRKVRKLKALGLTESLGTGYRLSPRGQAIRAELSSREGGGQGLAARG